MYNFIVLRWGVSCWRGIISLVRVSVLLGIRVGRWWLLVFQLLFVWSVCLTINSIFCLNLIYVNMLHVYSYFMSVMNGELMIFFNSVQHFDEISNLLFLSIFGTIVDGNCQWGVFSVKLSSLCSCLIYHKGYCISHQIRDLARFVTPYVTIFGSILEKLQHCSKNSNIRSHKSRQITYLMWNTVPLW